MATHLSTNLPHHLHRYHRHLLHSLTPPPPPPQPPSNPPLLSPHEPSHDADIISQHNPFHAMESSLRLYGISLSCFLINQTLIRLAHISKLALSFFFSSRPEAVDVASFNLIVNILGKVCQFDVVWEMILKMGKLNLKPQSSTFLTFIRRLIAAGYTRQAIHVFDDMPSFVEGEVELNDFVYLIDILCKYGYVRVAMEVFNKRKSEFRVCDRVYGVLIDGWCKLRQVDMGERLLREMIEKGIEPNVVCYNSLINGICRKSSLHPDDRFERTLRAAQRVFDEMRERGIEPDVVSYSILIHVCSRAHKPDLCLDRLEMMKARGICPSVATYTSVVKCLSSCGRLDEAEKLVNEMVENGVTPSAVTYNCFFKELRGRKDAEKALALYRRMKKEGVCVPSLHTYNILVQMFVKLDKMDVVEEIWNDMKEAGAGLDLVSYTVLVHVLIAKEKWKEACEYFVQMIEKGLLPQKVTFEMLYRGLIQANKLRTWRRLKKKLDEESISFGSEFEDYHLQPYKR